MPPQRVHRSAQYSAFARPGMMRSTFSRALHSGQFDRTDERAAASWGSFRSMVAVFLRWPAVLFIASTKAWVRLREL
jgi:hypothetical protein